jgi:hypothetical protein
LRPPRQPITRPCSPTGLERTLFGYVTVRLRAETMHPATLADLADMTAVGNRPFRTSREKPAPKRSARCCTPVACSDSSQAVRGSPPRARSPPLLSGQASAPPVLAAGALTTLDQRESIVVAGWGDGPSDEPEPAKRVDGPGAGPQADRDRTTGLPTTPLRASSSATTPPSELPTTGGRERPAVGNHMATSATSAWTVGVVCPSRVDCRRMPEGRRKRPHV